MIEESFLRQNSRIQWLKEGDQNTGFFHRVVKVKQSKSKIISLVDVDGTVITAAEDIKIEILHHYKNFLGITYPGCSGVILSTGADSLQID